MARVSTVEPGIRGSFGSDVLGRFGSVVIDYAGQRLLLGVN